MATDFKSIPLIDISPLLAKWDDPNMAQDQGITGVVKQLDQACREAGFFYVKGHGIPDSIIKEVRNVARKFFSLPYEEKLKIKISPTTGYRGYQRMGENITKGIPDMHEAIDCYREVKPGMYGTLSKPLEGPNQWPINPPNLKQLMEEYISLCTDLSRKIMRGIALALGASADEFEGERAGDPFWVFRIIGYPVLSHANGKDMTENDIGCGAHTDYGLLTLVNQDADITALEVRNQSGEWISAPPVPGTFVCNIGDMLKPLETWRKLQILTNGLYESTFHRVINKSPTYRVCVAYFYETNFDAAIKPLDICIRRTGGTKKFERAVYGEHLVSKHKKATEQARAALVSLHQTMLSSKQNPQYYKKAPVQVGLEFAAYGEEEVVAVEGAEEVVEEGILLGEVEGEMEVVVMVEEGKVEGKMEVVVMVEEGKVEGEMEVVVMVEEGILLGEVKGEGIRILEEGRNKVDISPLLSKWDDPNMAQDQGITGVVKQLDQACREAGFFYVKGHGIPNSIIKEVGNVAHKFFSLLYEEKLKIKISPTTGYRGYQRIGENITKGIPDMHEAIDDADITALEVRNQSGGNPLETWRKLQILTNGLYESTFHRVINKSPTYRVCVAYFYETNFDPAIEPLDICIKRTGGTKKFERAVYGEHLVSKETTNFVKEDKLDS
ncbi:unnamed protein product [Camellia sinensis]